MKYIEAIPAVIALLIIVTPAANAQNASEPRSIAEIYGPVAGFPNPACTCIKNADGKCMTLGRGVYPYRQFDEYISGPFCVTGCYPGYDDVYGYSRQTKKELVECRIDWKRLRHDLARDDFPQWQWGKSP